MTARQFIALGPGDTPRWLLPLGEPQIGEALRGWQPRRWWTRLAWQGVRAAVRCGKLDSVPYARCLRLDWISAVDWRKFGWSRREDPIPVLHLGTAGPARKIIVHLVDRGSMRCELIVKVPLTPVAAVAILREADILTQVVRDGIAGTPRLVHADRHQGVSAQTVVEGTADGRILTAQHWRTLKSLELPEEGIRLTEMVLELQGQISGRRDLAGEAALQMAFMQMADDAPLRACWIHGDFAPWNIKRRSDGSMGLVDWEDARRGGLPLQDAFHYTHMQRHVFGSKRRPAFRELSEPARDLGIDNPLCRKLELAYLATSYLRQRQRGNGGFADYLLGTLSLAVRA